MAKPLYNSKQEEINLKCWENVIHAHQEIVTFLLPESKSADKNAVFLLFVSGTKPSSPSEWMVTPSSSISVGLRVFLFVDDRRKNGGSWNEKTKLRVGSDFVIPDLKSENKSVANVHILVFTEDANVLPIWGIYKNDYPSHFFVEYEFKRR